MNIQWNIACMDTSFEHEQCGQTVEGRAHVERYHMDIIIIIIIIIIMYSDDRSVASSKVSSPQSAT